MHTYKYNLSWAITTFQTKDELLFEESLQVQKTHKVLLESIILSHKHEIVAHFVSKSLHNVNLVWFDC